MMKKYKSLLWRFIPILLVMALTANLSNALFQNMVDATTDACWEELTVIRDETAADISTRLSNNIKMLNLAADAIVLNTNLEDEAAVRAYLADMMHETIFDRMDVMFPDGTILVSTTGQRIPGSDDKSFEELVANSPYLTQRVPDFLTGQQAIHALSPVYDAAGEPIALLGATIYCTTLAELFSTSHYGEDAQLFLVDLRDGCIVLDKWHQAPGSIYDMMGYTPSENYSGEDFISDIMSGHAGTLDYESQRYAQTSYTVYTPVKGTYFTLIMVVQEDVLFTEVKDLETTLKWVGSAEMFLLAFFALWIYFILRRSMRIEGRAQQAELALLYQKEMELERQYAAAANRQEFLEVMANNLPGGYHRCTTDHSFRLTFISKSFTQITGYTMEQVQAELDGSYLRIVAPEDQQFFLSLAPQLEQHGNIHCAYRIRRRDGSVCWVQDSTQYVERDGEKYYQCALMDISERVEELEKAKLAAEASSRAKSTFLFNISHDIRTPMNAIKGFSRIIEENAGDPQTVLETIAKLNQAGDSLMMLMNDVLDISRIERGKETLTLQPMDLLEQEKSLYEMFASDMEAAGIRFVLGGDMCSDYVYCDHLKMTRVLMNMLSNARKFTPPGGTVTFGAVRLGGDEKACTYRFFVRDTGIGMSPEFLSRAYEQFERERTSTESGVTGSGLGLAIVKMMVELMGGRVAIQSELGKGTEISAVLTFQLAERFQTITNSPEQIAPKLSGKRVLLVEDNDFNREIARYILESMELTVEEAVNGAICIEKLLSAAPGHYDFILMDIQMPVMDGYTATIEIRNLQDRQHAAIPIIAMTANAFEEDRRRCMEVGMNGHIGKPIDVNDLLQTIAKTL